MDIVENWPATAGKIRTLWFLTAMIPVAILCFLGLVVSLLFCTPLIIYSKVTGKHLKDPRFQSRVEPPGD